MVAIVFIFLWLWSGLSLIEKENKTTDTWSYNFTDKEEKLSFLTEYIVAPSEILDAEYHIFFHDNSGGLVPGPSDWDIRVAIKIKPENIFLWTEDFEKTTSAEINLTWWNKLSTDYILWTDNANVEFYKRENKFSYLVVFKDAGIILKAMSTMPYLPSNSNLDASSIDSDNPFFFPKDKMSYNAEFESNEVKENCLVIKKDIIMTVRKIEKLSLGTVYSLEVDMNIIKRDGINQYYFYVQSDKIYKISKTA